jgi:hypothetical protein
MEKSEVPRICEDHFTLDSFETTEDEEAHKGGFQLLYLIITELKSHMTC